MSREAHKRRMVRRKIKRFRKRKVRNFQESAERSARCGKTWWCLKCPAALICMQRGKPDRVHRCQRCGVRSATWMPRWESRWDDDGTQRATRVTVVRTKRCPNVHVVPLVGCDVCGDVPF